MIEVFGIEEALTIAVLVGVMLTIVNSRRRTFRRKQELRGAQMDVLRRTGS